MTKNYQAKHPVSELFAMAKEGQYSCRMQSFKRNLKEALEKEPNLFDLVDAKSKKSLIDYCKENFHIPYLKEIYKKQEISKENIEKLIQPVETAKKQQELEKDKEREFTKLVEKMQKSELSDQTSSGPGESPNKAKGERVIPKILANHFGLD